MHYIVMLVNNIDFFEFFCQTKAPTHNVTYVFINDTRKKNLLAEITEVMHRYEVYNAYALNGKEIIDAFARETSVDNEFFRNFVLMLKMLIPWYFFQSEDRHRYIKTEKIVLLDDDLITPRDIIPLFDYNFACGAEYFKNVHEGEEWENFKKCFETNMTLEHYNKRRLNSGVMVLSRKVGIMNVDYEHVLKNIFTNEYFNRTYHEVKHFKTLREGVYKIFFTEQKYYNMIMKLCGYERITNINIKVLQDKFDCKRTIAFERRIKDWHIVHYCGGRGRKIDYVNWLRKWYATNI